jgi:hypothetical protein
MNLGIKAFNFVLMWFAFLAFITEFVEESAATVIAFHSLLITGWVVIGVGGVLVMHRNKPAYRKLILSTKEVPIEKFIKYELSLKNDVAFATALERKYSTFVSSRVQQYQSSQLSSSILSSSNLMLDSSRGLMLPVIRADDSSENERAS